MSDARVLCLTYPTPDWALIEGAVGCAVRSVTTMGVGGRYDASGRPTGVLPCDLDGDFPVRYQAAIIDDDRADLIGAVTRQGGQVILSSRF